MVSHRSLSALSCFLLATSFSLLPAFAWNVAAQSTVRLDLGTEVVTYAPDVEAAIPLTINSQGEGPVKVIVEIGYPSEMLALAGVKPGAAVARAKGELRSSEKETQEGGKPQNLITIEVDAPTAMVVGTIANLTFRAKDAAVHGTGIEIKNVSRTAKASSGEDLPTQGTSGMITLMQAIAPCFLYMH
jgi:hypothetical protein